MSSFVDLAGRRFGKLTVVKLGERSIKGRYRWTCRCDCGKTTQVFSYNLLNGHTRSCGCIVSGITQKTHSTHGKSNSPLYAVWASMISRCTNRAHISYHNYGGRGISVCSRWKKFANFYHDMSDCYRMGLQLDRIDNNGNYEPSNCHWVTPIENGKNKRNNVFITMNGARLTESEWARVIGVSGAAIIKMMDKHRLDGDIIIEGGARDNTDLPKTPGIPDGCPWELTPDGNELQRRCSV